VTVSRHLILAAVCKPPFPRRRLIVALPCFASTCSLFFDSLPIPSESFHSLSFQTCRFPIFRLRLPTLIISSSSPSTCLAYQHRPFSLCRYSCQARCRVISQSPRAFKRLHSKGTAALPLFSRLWNTTTRFVVRDSSVCLSSKGSLRFSLFPPP